MVKILRYPNFKAAAKSSNKAVHKEFVLNVRMHDKDDKKNISHGEARVGFIVTKSMGKAVIRNRIRRRLKAAAYETIGSYGKDNRDYIFIGRKHALDCSYNNLINKTISALKITKSWQ